MKKALVIIGIVLIAAAGISFVASRNNDGLAVLTQGTKYEAVSKADLKRKPLIDLPWFGGRLVWPPKPKYSLPLAGKGVAGFIGFRGHAADMDYSWEIDGRRLDRPLNQGFSEEWIAAPTVFGTESREAILHPGGRAVPIRVRLPAIGVKAPILEAYERQVGDIRLTITPRPLITPRAPIVYDIRAQSSNPNEVIAVVLNMHHPKNTTDALYGLRYLTCSPTPGKVLLSRWFHEAVLHVEIIRVRQRKSIATVHRQDKGGGSKIRIVDSLSHVSSSATRDRSGIGWWFDTSGFERFEMRYQGQALGVRTLTKEMTLDKAPLTDLLIIAPALNSFKDGQQIAIETLTLGKPTSIYIPVTLPDPSLFFIR